MSKRHFEAIARRFAALRASYDDELEAQAIRALDRLAADLAEEFKRENERFDRVRFLAACGVSE